MFVFRSLFIVYRYANVEVSFELAKEKEILFIEKQ